MIRKGIRKRIDLSYLSLLVFLYFDVPFPIFFHLNFSKILRVYPDQKPWLHFLKILKNVIFVRENSANPHEWLPYLSYDYPCTKNEVLHKGFLQQMWQNPQFPADLVTFTGEILNGKLHFLCSVYLLLGWNLFKFSKNELTFRYDDSKQRRHDRCNKTKLKAYAFAF